MINNALEGFLFDIPASTITETFLWLILAVFLFALFEAWKKNYSRFLENAPNIMTSLGILGTFTGIVVGLLHFDTANIDESITLLLAGLKTAFITSLFGMFSAIVFKAADSMYFAGKRDLADTPAEVTPSHIHNELKKANEQLFNLKESMAGSEEGSLVGQMKLARGEIRDSNQQRAYLQKEFQEKLFNEMQHFAEMLSKSATEQVIEALRQVILDFNRNLTEQFGDNFKRLDASVQKLVVWQQQYMEQLTQMAEQYAEGVKAIDQTREAVGQIGDKTAEIPASMDKLQNVLQVNQHQIQELQRHLEAFVQMRDKAVEAVPTINSRLDEVGIKLNESAHAMQTILQEGATEFGQTVDRTNQAMLTMANNIETQSESVNQTLQDTSTEFGKTARDMLVRLEDGAKSLQSSLDRSVEQTLTEVRRSIEKTTSSLEQEVTRAVGRTGDGINKTLEGLDTALSDEMERVMVEMGRALTTITSQFTKDYERLVSAMDKVVKIQVR